MLGICRGSDCWGSEASRSLIISSTRKLNVAALTVAAAMTTQTPTIRRFS